MMLTPKQRECIDYLQFYTHTNGYSPSFVEIMGAMGIHSKSGVHRLLAALEERGYIYRLKNRKRAIQIVDYPELGMLRSYSDQSLLEECTRRGLIKFTAS
jgi:repressor LexA